jgi:ribosome maturation factor RimP
MFQKEQILTLFEKEIENKTIFIVELSIQAGNKIKLFIDSFNGITIDECAQVSRILTEKLNLIDENFEIEISSPGLGSIFKVPQQYQKNIGKQIEIVKKDGLKIIAKLIDFVDNTIEIEEQKSIKPEGKKKKELIIIKSKISLNEIKSVKSIIVF